MRAVLVALALLLSTVGSFAMEIAHIKVMKSGEILLEDKPVTLDQLKVRLLALKKSGGGVYYYRENAARDPAPWQMDVIEVVLDLSLPISLSTGPDYSDSVGPDGQSHPRSE